MIVREPVGVVGAITPWNSPLLLMSWKLAPALAAGCTVVVKPSEHSPVSTLAFVELVTEAGSDPHAGYESLPTSELVALMNDYDSTVPAAVAAATAAIADAIDAIAAHMRAGGRLVYVGAGSSGLLAALDAAECEATFSTPPGLVAAVVAGGGSAAPLAQAAAEDDREAGARDLGALDIRQGDAVVGVSASGSTPYVVGALETAAAAGALTCCVVCAPGSTLGSPARARSSWVITTARGMPTAAHSSQSWTVAASTPLTAETTMTAVSTAFRASRAAPTKSG